MSEQDYGPYLGQDSYCRFNASRVTAHVDAFVRVPTGDVEALETAIAEHGPTAVNFDASHRSLLFYDYGVYKVRARLIIERCTKIGRQSFDRKGTARVLSYAAGRVGLLGVQAVVSVNLCKCFTNGPVKTDSERFPLYTGLRRWQDSPGVSLG